MQACRWQAPHQKQRLSLMTPMMNGTSPLSAVQASPDAPDMQLVSSKVMADVLSAMIDSSQYELLERFCSRAGERALKRLCAPPDSGNALKGWSKVYDEHVCPPYVTSMAINVVGEGRSRGMRMYTGYSDGRMHSMHFHFGDEVRHCLYFHLFSFHNVVSATMVL